MRSEEFVFLLFNNWELYLFYFLINSFFAFLAFRRIIRSVIDPLLLPVSFSVFANTIPPFLYTFHLIESSTFLYFVLSVLCFWTGFMMNNRSTSPSNRYFYNDSSISKILYYVFYVNWILVKGLTYYLQGVPLFMESRLDLYANSGGVGILGRFETVLSLFCLLYSFDIIYSRKRGRWIAFLFLFLWTLSAVLSGSKSAFMGILNAYFFFSFYVIYKKVFFKKVIKYLLLAVIVGIIILVAQRGSDISSSLYMLFFRFIANGDIYWEAYPLNLQDSIVIQNPILHLFQGLLGGLRLVDYSDPSLGTAIGFQVHRTVYPELSDLSVGPNARIPILSFILFKWYGLFFSFLLGCIVSFVLFKLYKYLPQGIIGTTIYALFYMNFITFITDPVLACANFFNTLLGLFVLLSMTLLLHLLCHNLYAKNNSNYSGL